MTRSLWQSGISIAKCLVVLLAAAVPAPAVSAERGPPPHPGCLDARQLERATALAPDALAVLQAGGRRFHLTTSDACPGMEEVGAALRLLSREGWVCGRGGEFVQVGGAEPCPLARLTEIDAARYAFLLRESDAAKIMDPVEVTGRVGTRARLRSPDYCFARRHLRNWHQDSKGLLVSVDKRRSGGYGRYRVELAGACPDLTYATHIEFRSTMSSGLICGIAGEQVLAVRETPSRSMLQGEEGFAAAPIMRSSCAVSLVYPEPE